jgi:hypothetical protein
MSDDEEPSARTTPFTPPQRHGDRGSRDDDAAALRSPLQRLLRFRDLQDAHVVRSWTQLRNLIQREGFPVGRLLSPNTRVWGLDEIEHWLGNRPVGRLGERKAEAAEAE